MSAHNDTRLTEGPWLDASGDLEKIVHARTPSKLLLVASTGGHLAQLVKFSRRWNLSEDSVWITFDSPQSRSLLEGRRVEYVPYVPPRGFREALVASRRASEILERERFDWAVSTGAALALGVLPAVRAKGLRSTYIESVSRVNGPSLTGKLLHASRLTGLRSQHAWANGRWKPIPSVLSHYEPVAKTRDIGGELKMFVTLGTIRPYRFDSLVDGVLGTGLASERTVWQLGVTERDDLPGSVHQQMAAEAFKEAALNADVVVTHAGVGTILELLEWGIHPVVVARKSERGEHVDNHQAQITALVQSLGVATVADSQELTAADLVRATQFSTTERRA
ncbi:glycosyltransferase [Microbacterium lacus]|uniref:Glycosyltransferase n=1 Tax=Microbacterium lacus TaxID=415217 RepID=A0ABN2G704_9MICO